MLKVLFNWFIRLFSFLTKPVSKDIDFARREFILNLLLLTAITLAFTTFIVSLSANIIDVGRGDTYTGVSPVIIFIIFLIFVISYVISRLGKSRWVSLVFIVIYFLAAIYTSFRWGVDIPQALLLYALIIVMSGILIGSRFAVIMTLKIIVVLFFLIHLQTSGIIQPDHSWKFESIETSDVTVFSITFLIIAVVSWLFNSEMEKSLVRARKSEAALKQERDSLEVRVEERTRELKESQIEQMTQMYKFAELGKMASGIFHDLTNPIALVSLSLESLNEKSHLFHKKELDSIQEHLKRAVIGTKRLETFMMAARKNIQNHDISQKFSLSEELKQVVQILNHKAKQNSVKMNIDSDEDITIIGNPIKLHQCMLNLMSNAIDAYPPREDMSENREVHVSYTNEKGTVIIKVQDNGMGIAKEHLVRIFEPLFTTKSSEKGTGLGLAICKDIIERYFHGNIYVSSTLGEGTTFTIEFPIKSLPKES